MQITYALGRRRKEGEGTDRFLLSNKKGTFFILGNETTSDFDGLFVHDKHHSTPFKTLQNISIQGCPDALTHHINWVERHTQETTESFYLGSTALIYDVTNYTGDITLTLDCKRLYDDDVEGRVYAHALTQDDYSILHTKYVKYDSGGNTSYQRHVLIATQAAISVARRWVPCKTPFDAQRGMPEEIYVHEAANIHVSDDTRVIIVSSATEKKAREKLAYALENQDEIVHGIRHYTSRKGDDMTEIIAHNALDSLIENLSRGRGIYAGLPWFFQYWMRDEAISLHALTLQGHYALAKEILMRWVNIISENNLSAHDQGGLATADGPGWVARRLHDLIVILGKQKYHFFTREELHIILEAFDQYLSYLPRDRYGLITNKKNETWMDTDPHGNGREGTRVEIQACTLVIYDLLIMLAQELKTSCKHYIDLRKKLIHTTHEWFYDRRGFLLDGYNLDGGASHEQRPNIFLAWYLAPDLLSTSEWRSSFDAALDKLWLAWGGLSTVAIDNERFHSQHSGMNNESYHQGDSWYFINNIAAIALFSIDPHRYHDKIEKILFASTNDLLFQGFLGHASEISDAAKQSAIGCRAQAWSAAMLIELLHKMRH